MFFLLPLVVNKNVHNVWYEKSTEGRGCQVVKTVDDTFRGFDASSRVWQTSRRTDGQTESLAITHTALACNTSHAWR